MKTKSAAQSISREPPFGSSRSRRPVSMPLALDGVNLDVANDLDLAVVLDPTGEVVGHALAQVASAQQQRDPGGVLGQEHRRLASRVAATHDGGAAVLARARMHRGAGIEDPRAVPSLAPGNRETLVGGARRNQNRPATDDLPVVEDEAMHLVLAGHRTDLDRGDELSPELQGLEVAPVRQVRTSEAGGESHVILDPRAGSRLAARAESVEDDGGESLGGAVDRGGEAGWPGSDDHQVERLRADRALQAQALGQAGDRGSR